MSEITEAQHTSVKNRSAHRNVQSSKKLSAHCTDISKVKTERSSSPRVVKTVQLTDMSAMRTAQRSAQGRHVRAQTIEVRSK